MRIDGGRAFSEGFRLIGREPWTVAGWIGLQLLINLVGLGAVYLGLSANAGALQNWANSLNDRREALIGAVIGGAGLALVGLLLGLILQAVMLNAIYRAVLEPNASRAYARLRLGGREFWMALHLVAYTIVVLGGIGLTLWGIAAATKQAWLAVLLSPFMPLAVVTLFTLSGPAVFARGGFRLFSTFPPAIENFWQLVLCNFLLCLVTVGAWILALIAGVAQSLALQGQTGAVQPGDFSQVAPMMASLMTSPAYLVGMVVNTMISVLYLTAIVAPAARAYADVYGEAGGTAEVFS